MFAGVVRTGSVCLRVKMGEGVENCGILHFAWLQTH